jgi:hypothetical protein
MKTALRKYKYLVVFLLFLLVIYAMVPSVNYTNCLNSQKFQVLIFDGVVVNKYLDKSQHSTPIVEIKNFEGRIDSVDLLGDHSGLYNKMRVNDTLKKESGSNEIQIKIDGMYTRFGVADFNCDSTKLKSEEYLFWVYDLFGTVPPDNTLKEESKNEK